MVRLDTTDSFAAFYDEWHALAVLAASGRILESHDVPDGWLHPNAVSQDGSKVCVIGEHEGAPAIIVVGVEYSEVDQGDL